MRRIALSLALVFGALALALTAFAQGPTPPAAATLEWKPLVAAAVNTVGVLLVVQLLKAWLPALRTSMPWLLPILATVAGPLLLTLQNALSTWLGLGVDLSPLVGLATGASATALHQVGKQMGPPSPTAARLLVLGLLLPALGGCAQLVLGTDAAKVVEALGRDNASVCLRLNATLYGSAVLCRSNHDKARLSVDQDGAVAVQHE